MGLKPKDLRPRTVYAGARLLAEGMHERDLRSEAMLRVLPGRFTRSDAPAGLNVIAAAALDGLGRRALISHETAAELFGFPLPRCLTHAGGAPVHCRALSGPRSSSALLVVHVRSAVPSLHLHGVEMTHPVITLQEIAPRLTRSDRVAAVDALVADRHGTARRLPLDEVRDMAEGLRGRGAAELREAVGAARERTWSPRETALRLMLLDHGWPEPARNVPLVDPATGLVYYGDLMYPQWGVVIEYDGALHHEDPSQVAKDRIKDEALHALGLVVLRARADDLREPGSFFARLEHAVRRMGGRRTGSQIAA